MAPATSSHSPGARRRQARRAVLALAIALGAASLNSCATTAALSQPVDAGDVRGPLDLSEVTLSQRDVRMSLHITTTGSWSAKDVTATPGRELCVTLIQGAPATPIGRVCVARRDARPALSFTPQQADGTQLATRPLAAQTSRPTQSSFDATFLPVSVGLRIGPLEWFAGSMWTDADSCPDTCSDRLPDDGVISAGMSLLGVAPCFGAAARDPLAPCENPDLRLSVEPSLEHARDLYDSYCEVREQIGLMSTCTFGATVTDAAQTFALVGDSHAGGMKTALAVVTLAKRWRGMSNLLSGCPPTQATTPRLPTVQRSQRCARWNDEVLAWLAQHREVQTVFLAAHATASVVPGPGRDMAQALAAGYREELHALLRRVPSVVVIRDPPSSRRRQLGCVAAALHAGSSPGPACSLPRADVLPDDPLASAALALHSPRVLVIDLTPHFCDETRCFPVIGGVLVQRDETHLTPTFSATLGPYLLQALG